MSASHNDGTVVYGSRNITLKTPPPENNTWQDYEVDSISLTRPVNRIERTDHIGDPSGSVGQRKFVNGTLTGVQLQSPSTKAPQEGMRFTETFDSNRGAETFIIETVTLAEQKDGENKYTCNFVKKYANS